VADKPGPSGPKGFWPDWVTPRRAWEFARNIIRLERNVASLQDDNQTLRSEIAKLHKSVTEHDAQLRLLTAFVRDSLSNRLEARIEQLAREISDKKTS
jgi:predicted RNase H-like nuclease (RuvC/YqgF family)